MKGSDGCAGELGELNGAEFGFVDWSAGAVGGEDGGLVLLENLAKAEDAFAAAS